MKGLFRRWRQVRWVVVAAALPLVWACNSRTLETPVPNPTQATNNTFQAAVNRKIDILFMVDNSQSMAPLQNSLLTNFPVFMNILKSLPNGLPDIHVAVVSSDTGPGVFDEASGHCAHNGDSGVFQTAPRGACAASPLPADQHFLAASNNQGTKNYTGDITDAFTCIARLGDQGCGFEGQLKSVRWALDQSNPENDNFLRPEAFLAVILITNEDDCSVPDDSDLFDPAQQTMADTYGPFWSFRCNEFGHLCQIGGTPTPPPRGSATSATNLSNIQGCVSNDTDSSKLTKLTDEINFLKSLKSDPNQIFVAAITGIAGNTGLPEPYTINMVQKAVPNGPSEYQPEIAHVCVLPSDTTQYADPAVRITQWVQAFADHGLEMSICTPDFTPALTQIGNQLKQALGPECVAGKLIDSDLNTADIQPSCQISNRDRNGNGTLVETAIKQCGADVNASPKPCWTLTVDATQCPTMNGPNHLLTVVTDTMDPSSRNHVVQCALCAPNSSDPGCQY